MPANIIPTAAVRSIPPVDDAFLVNVASTQGAMLELEYRQAGPKWASETDQWDTHLISSNPAVNIAIPAQKVDIHKDWEVRVHTATNAGFRSPWSPAVKVAAREKAKENTDASTDKKDTPGHAVLATAVNNGSGKYKTGGSSPAVALSELSDDDLLQFLPKAGSCSYVIIHGRTSRGVWTILHRGGISPMRVGMILTGRRNAFTHHIFSANGEHERYQRRACTFDIVNQTAADKKSDGGASTSDNGGVSSPAQGTEKGLGEAVNHGTGLRKSGGTLIWTPISEVKDNDKLHFT
ncbi:MAG: hypothetical protein JXR76_06510 [Deltaproteobacteria bacterium]|nr:hypothetical protein [Deltaproteobacteria bacterium]